MQKLLKKFSELTVQQLIDEMVKVEDKSMKVLVWKFSDLGSWSEETSKIEISIDSDGFNILDF